jgi:hypothetical protein
MQPARKRRRIFPRQGHAQGVGRAARLARRQHASDGRAPLGKRALEDASALRDERGFRPHGTVFRFEGGERAVQVGDGALRVAQRVARLPARLLGALELARQRVDAPAQGLEVFFLRRCPCGERAEAGKKDEEAPQAFAFP